MLASKVDFSLSCTLGWVYTLLAWEERHTAMGVSVRLQFKLDGPGDRYQQCQGFQVVIFKKYLQSIK